MAGAVDLAAVKARSEAAARAAEAPAPTAGDYVFEVTEAGFQAEVLDRSFQLPVLLVFTSTRAPSGDQLAATLESLVRASNGTLVLGKVDADTNARVAQALQVQAVPVVFAVIAGQLIPGFEGALPEPQVRQFVDAVLEAGKEAGFTGAAAEAEGEAVTEPAAELPEDPRFTAAEAALEAGDYALATQRYQAILAQEPANQEAALALGQVQLIERLESVDPDAAQRADADLDDIDAQLAAADLLFAANDITAALDRLLESVARSSGDDREHVRKRLLEFFDLLGPDDPRVPAARRELARALF
jgi:putative thioredoxin